MTRPGGLGRGLGALIPAAGPGTSGLLTLRMDSVVPNPRQPREAFDEEPLAELAHSIRQVGVLQPILVRPRGDGRYETIAGERRLRAAELAGLTEVPAVVRQTDDRDLLTEALLENLHRVDLNPLEEAGAYRQLLDDFGLTHDALAEKLGRSRSAITNTLRLLSLPPAVQHLVADGTLSAGHARALLALSDAAQQQRMAERIIEEGLSVRAAEELVRGADGTASDDGDRPAARPRPTPYRDLQDRLVDALATRVRITGSAKRGRVVIDYAGKEDLERLLEILSRGTGRNLLSE